MTASGRCLAHAERTLVGVSDCMSGFQLLPVSPLWIIAFRAVLDTFSLYIKSKMGESRCN